MPRHHRRPRAYRRPTSVNAGFAALRTDLGEAKTRAPGTAAWRDQHGRKAPMTFCEALRTLKGMSLHLVDDQPLNVYACTLGRSPDDPAAAGLHWHIGHRRPRGTRGVTLL